MIELILISIFPAAMVFAAMSDLFTMTISNRVSLGLVAGFAILVIWTGMDWTLLLSHVSAGGVMLLVAIVLFALGWIGGGDAKLFAATSLWFGWVHLLEYAVWASLFGGALTFLIVMGRTVPLPSLASRQTWVARLHAAESGIPYGVALAAAGLLVYPNTKWLSLIA